MKSKLLLAAAAPILLGLLMSCTEPGISDVEFATALMEEVANTAGDETGLYPTPSKSAGPGDGITITFDPWEVDPPEGGVYNLGLTITFDDYIPTFAPNSLVSGELTALLAVDIIDPENPVITIVFTGALVVTGEHAGTYDYNATLIIYLATGEYDYSGSVKIGGTVHEVTK